MTVISCPWCGAREDIEFRFGGQSHIARPEPASEVTAVEWADYLFTRENPRGAHRERWVHADGCGRWFNLVRNTVTHRILATYQMAEPAPEHGAGVK